MKEIRVLLVDDHQIIIDGIGALLNSTDGIKLLNAASNGKEALEILKILSVDVVLMDIDMPIMNGLDAAKQMKRNHPDTKIIMLSMHSEQSMIRELIQMGVDGYLLKNTTKEELVNAIKKVNGGGQYFSAEVTLRLMETQAERAQHQVEGVELTNREIEILKLIADGYTNKEIGVKLFISHRTVDSHRTNLMKKLEVNNVAGLINYAIRHGFLT